MDRVEEKRLLRAAQTGDADAFAALYRANVQPVFRYVYYRVGEHELAEDLTADVFARALKGIRRFEDQGKPFIAWLYRIASGRVIDHYRKVNRHPEDALNEVNSASISTEVDMDQAILQRQTAGVLQQAIAGLTADQQQVIILRFVEDKRLEEVALIMGKKTNAIKQLQHRALRALASRLTRSGINLTEILSGLSS